MMNDAEVCRLKRLNLQSQRYESCLFLNKWVMLNKNYPPYQWINLTSTMRCRHCLLNSRSAVGAKTTILHYDFSIVLFIRARKKLKPFTPIAAIQIQGGNGVADNFDEI